MEKLEAMILQKHNIKPRGPAAAEEPAAAPAGKKEASAKGEALAPDGKPVVKIAPPAAKNGAAEEPKRAPKPAN